MAFCQVDINIIIYELILGTHLLNIIYIYNASYFVPYYSVCIDRHVHTSTNGSFEAIKQLAPPSVL